MRIAAVYDIHANLPALEAVLEEIRKAEVDQLLVGGDVFPGPMPLETIECLLGLDIPTQFIHGNGDREVLARMKGAEVGHLPEAAREAIDWTAQQLPSKYEKLLAGWPATLSLSIEGLGEVLVCHATPRNDTEIFTRLTEVDRLFPVFAGLSASVVICGHTHMQFDWRIGKIRVVNAGSVGMPFGEAGADWLLLGPDIQLQHTSYDLTEAAERIRSTKYPQAREFAARNVLQPPSEKEILEVFRRVELQ